MPTESVDRDVNEDDDTEEETGGAYSVRNSEKAKVVFERRLNVWKQKEYQIHWVVLMYQWKI